MKKDVSNKALIWAALGSIAGLLIILWVTAAVDATNSFGATVRTPFSGVIENLGSEWKLHELNIEQ